MHVSDLGIQSAFEEERASGIKPAILLLEKTVVKPTGIGPQRVVTIAVKFKDAPERGPMKSRFCQTVR